jgi:archaellum component FlaG (FlaF/FlaG flagellin family)
MAAILLSVFIAASLSTFTKHVSEKMKRNSKNLSSPQTRIAKNQQPAIMKRLK